MDFAPVIMESEKDILVIMAYDLQDIFSTMPGIFELFPVRLKFCFKKTGF
jgi:hypothetical protein